jgi:hypothetical protein
MKKQYRFSDLDREHQVEVIGNLGTRARKTVWELVPDFPVDLAAAMAWDTSVLIFDDHVESVVRKIEQAGKVLRPILIDDLDEDYAWMEGRHRSIASENMGLKTIPALVRVK